MPPMWGKGLNPKAAWGSQCTGKGQGNEPLAPHLIAHTQPLLLPDTFSGDAIAAGDPVVIADPGGEIRGRVIGMDMKREGAAEQQ